jgi:hypothetical protein
LLETPIVALPVLVMVSETLVLDLLDLRLQERIVLGLVGEFCYKISSSWALF